MVVLVASESKPMILGMRVAARIAMIEITTNSSSSVKPLKFFILL